MLLYGDWRRRVTETGTLVEILLTSDPLLIKEAWSRMEGWYKADIDHPPPPDRVTLKHMTVERLYLYRWVNPPREITPVKTDPLPIDASILSVDKIEWLEQRMRQHRLGGPSGMR